MIDRQTVSGLHRCRFTAVLIGVTLLLGACAGLPPPQDAAPNVVVTWNELALTAVRNEPAIRPPVVARQLFMLHAAMYDAWSTFDRSARPYALDVALKIPPERADAAGKVAAVSQAAYQILHHEFPRFENNTQSFARQLTVQGLAPVEHGDPGTPAGIGTLAAQAVLRVQASDGANVEGGYRDLPSPTYPQPYLPVNSDDPHSDRVPGKPGFDPNHWQPLRIPYPSNPHRDGRFVYNDGDPGTYDVQTFLTPHWGALRPFALSSGAQFRPSPPPRLGSTAAYIDARGKQTTQDQAYREQVAEVLRINAELDEYGKVVAEFWADGPRSESPPGHWNQLAHGLSVRDHHRLDEDVKMYFALNAALHDACIATWDAKRYYDYVRPISAIHQLYYGQTVRGWGGPNRGTETMLGQDWQPYQQQTFITPAFPEYVSGHSTFSAAAATVLAQFTGSNRFYDGVTRTGQDIDRDGEIDLLGRYVFRAGAGFYEKGPSQPVVLQWATLQEAADQAGYSRLLGGIHFQDGDLRGRELGRTVGNTVYRKAAALWQGRSSEPQIDAD